MSAAFLALPASAVDQVSSGALAAGALGTFDEAAAVVAVLERCGVPSVVVVVEGGRVSAVVRYVVQSTPVDAASTWRPDGAWRLDGRTWTTPYGERSDRDLLELAVAPSAVVEIESRSASHPPLSLAAAAVERPGLLPWVERW